MSTAIRELPDVETLIVKHLQADARLLTLGLRQVAGPAPPKLISLKYPYIHVHRSGGVAPIPYWLDGGRCQIDVWGREDTIELRAITARAFALLMQGLVGVHPEGVVSGVVETVGRQWAPAGDTSRFRYLFEVAVTAHPNP